MWERAPLSLIPRAAQSPPAAMRGLDAEADAVYSVGIGTEGSGPADLDVELLQMIDEGPPGEYIHVEDAWALAGIFFGIFEEINICADISGHKYDDPPCDGIGGGEAPRAGARIAPHARGRG